MSASQAWWEPAATPPPEDGSNASLDFEKMDPETVSEDTEELMTRRVHILGTGSIGTFVAHSLKVLPNPPPISLLLHRPELYEDFKAGSRIVRLVNKNTDINDEQTGYDVDLIQENGTWRHISHNPRTEEGDRKPLTPPNAAEKMESGEVFIYTLIVTVKGPATIKALRSVQHRVDQRTTILLMQNGMGQIDDLNKLVFTDPETRPTYMLGIISHGCHMQRPFAVVHAGFGTVALGIYRDTDKYPLPPRGTDTATPDLSEAERKAMYPTDKDLYSNLSSRYLLRTLTRSPVLACAAYPYLDLFQLQLEKLVSNCVLNPLTALLDVQNGSMLENPHLTAVQRLLIAEISLVIRGLPELEGIPNARRRFSPARLENLFRAISKKTASNSSSMREDVRKIRSTEINYINGYIVKRGEEQGIKCVLNYMIMQLVKSRTFHDTKSPDAFVRNVDETQPSRSFRPYGAVSMEAERQDDAVVLEDTSKPREADGAGPPLDFRPLEPEEKEGDR
ncbi:2-dehydropantoate 2-reductase (Ketopantoate reductase) (KPA reductase) (KPR) [Knufia obscura]|uniref:2-dehydropantoate 2-reductase n=2 Tax=Knufia TaxID=430999 RepID=A0AAN8EBX2_9EURO|nr:2-dehydropantoate 2-reductase (Ketopantoate reductase) (KPA reductase) (KPR) [Knufia obscura]KAK5951834.1 2-dehydropantoate 2-reductase (Ketopantoate reductase) (KPA reductase) (KPR) [Knufia fluminis]